MDHRILAALAWTSTAFALGCASDLRDDDGSQPKRQVAPVTNTAEARGVTRTLIDATSADLWVYFDFESQSQVMPGDPVDSADWDLAFQRVRIQINGGVSGSGQMELARLDAADFDALERAPEGGYVTDQADGDDENPDPDLAFSSGELAWYAYDLMKHTLQPHDRVYVVRSVEGTYYKLQLLEYYDEAGTPGFPLFRWGELSAP